MFATVLFFAFMVIVTCERADVPWNKSPVKNRHQQCIDAGFDGLCKTVDKRPMAESCKYLWCAERTPDGRHVVRQWTCPDDGTHCGRFKVCERGICTPRKLMPIYTGVTRSFQCTRF